MDDLFVNIDAIRSERGYFASRIDARIKHEARGTEIDWRNSRMDVGLPRLIPRSDVALELEQLDERDFHRREVFSLEDSGIERGMSIRRESESCLLLRTLGPNESSPMKD